MENFENFLIAEFNEQHSNIRATESAMIQLVQYFFTIESVVLTGVITAGNILPQFLLFGFVLFWLMFLFGHLVYKSSINSWLQTLQVDFQNTLVRLYFAKQSPYNSRYLYFLDIVETTLGGREGEWEKLYDIRPSIARFVGTINALNLTVALFLSAYTVSVLSFPYTNILSVVTSNNTISLVVILVGLLLLITLARIYHVLVYVRTVRKEERNSITKRKMVLEKLADIEKSHIASL